MAGTSPRLFPREHGAYAVLLASWLCGVATAGRLTLGSFAALAAIFSLFLAQEPVKALIRQKGRGIEVSTVLIYRIFSLLCAGLIPLAIVASMSPSVLAVIPAGMGLACYSYLLYRRRAPLVAQSVYGFALLALAAPLVYLQSPESSLVMALRLWVELVVFFSAAALIVGIRLSPRAQGQCMKFFALILPAGFVAYYHGAYSIAGLSVLLLSAMRFAWIVLQLDRYLSYSLKKIGILEAVAAVVLVAIYFVAA